MCYSVQTLSGRTPLHQKSSDFFFGAANIRIFPFSAKLFPALPSRLWLTPEGRVWEGATWMTAYKYIGASSAKRMMLQYITLPSGTVNMSVDFRSKNALVPEHLLHSPQISPILNKMRGE